MLGAATAGLALASGFLGMLGPQWQTLARQVREQEEAEQEAAASAAEVAGLSAEERDAIENGENWGDVDEWHAEFGGGVMAYGSEDEEEQSVSASGPVLVD